MTFVIFIILGSLIGLGLGVASRRFAVQGDPLVDEIEALLPGGQCGQCGRAGCRQAAEAMVSGELGVDGCPPASSAFRLAAAKVLGLSASGASEEVIWLARVNESHCTGCNRCFKACPYDAIVGATKQLHTVVSDVCTGCRLCADTCPQGCIEIYSPQLAANRWFWPKPIELRG